MKRRHSVLIAMLLAIGCVFLACKREEEMLPAPISRNQINYAGELLFSWKIVIDGEPLVLSNPLFMGPLLERITLEGGDSFDPSYTELVFVRSEEDAVGFPDSTVVAWPSDEDITQGLINGLHLGMLRGDIGLEDFGLVYPITIQNLVDDWEKVNNLMRYIISERRLMNFLLI